MKLNTNTNIIELHIDKVPKRFHFDYIICRNPACCCNGGIMQLSNQDHALDLYAELETIEERVKGEIESGEKR